MWRLPEQERLLTPHCGSHQFVVRQKEWQSNLYLLDLGRRLGIPQCEREGPTTLWKLGGGSGEILRVLQASETPMP